MGSDCISFYHCSSSYLVYTRVYFSCGVFFYILNISSMPENVFENFWLRYNAYYAACDGKRNVCFVHFE